MALTRSRFARSDLLGREVYPLVTIEWAGQTIRLSTATVTVTTDDGEDLEYVGVLDKLEFESAIDLFADSASPASVPVEAIWPVDVPSLVAQGHDLSSAIGEISQWVEGTTYEDRVVRMVGRISDPEYGDADETVSCSIEEQVWDDANLIPSSTQQVDATTWDWAWISDSDANLSYPIIIGQPGYINVTGSQAIWGSKATSYHVLILAGHAVDATSVLINCDADTVGVTVNCHTEKDHRGQVVTVVDYHLDGYDTGQANDIGPDYQPAVATSTSIFVCWENGGGSQGADGTLIRKAGDVIEWALSQTSFPVDLGKTNAAKPLLSQFNIDAVIDARTSAWDWLSSILPLLPVSIVTGPKGLYPIVWRYWATASDAVATLDVDRDPQIERASKVRLDSTNIYNSYTLSYQYSMRCGTYNQVSRLGAYVEERATAIIHGYNFDRVKLVSRTLGSSGDGITITVSAGGALVLTESASAKTCGLQAHDLVSTTQDVIDAFNASSVLFTASLYDGPSTEVWSTPTTDQSVVSVLRSGAFAGSMHCDVSQRRYARVPGERWIAEKAVEAPCIYDPATADAVLGWMSLAYSFARRTVAYVAPVGDWGWLERGDVITLTDSSLHFEEQVCLVEETQHDDSGLMGIKLLILEYPARDNLETP